MLVKVQTFVCVYIYLKILFMVYKKMTDSEKKT